MLDKEIQNVVENMIIGKYDNDTLRNINSYIHKRVEDIERQLKLDKLKEKTELVEQDLIEFENKYTRYDIVNIIELSYKLANMEEMNKFDDLLDICTDGINLYGLFVKFCYDNNFDTYYSNLEKLIDLFIEKYFEEI